MSTNKHKYYRKVLQIEKSFTTINSVKIPVTTVLYALVDGQTSRTIKSHIIGFRVYVGNRHCNGVDAYHPRKLVSINLKNPLESKFFKDIGEYSLKRTKQNAFNDAWKRYVLSRPDLCKNIQGTVQYFDRFNGEGLVNIPSLKLKLPIYACNMIGKRTWYPETACMYVQPNQVVTFDLTDGPNLFFVSNVQDGIFDAEKWDGLDQSKLAFRCDENGNAVNGLFA